MEWICWTTEAFSFFDALRFLPKLLAEIWMTIFDNEFQDV
jgi:hypothetical protein